MNRFISEFRLYLCNHVVSRIPSHTFRLWYYRKIMGFIIGKGSSVCLHGRFDCTKAFSIGKNSVILAKCRLDNRGGITIGDNVSISDEVIILTADHDMQKPDFEGRHEEVIIKDYVWIGIRVVILPGVTIGKGAVIGAGSVVTKNVEPFQFVAGVPAKFVKNRIQDLVYDCNYRRLFQ